MVENYLYEEFVVDILKRIPAIPIKLLGACIINNFYNMTPKLAVEVIMSLQNKNKLIITADEYVIRKGLYSVLTGDNFFDNINKKEANFANITVGNTLTNAEKNTIDCLHMVVENLPASARFKVIASDPWYIMFQNEQTGGGGSELWQITKFTYDNIANFSELIKKEPYMSKGMRESIVRVAFVEDEDLVERVPYYGFRYICTANQEDESDYDLIEERDEDIWKDYPSYDAA